MFLTKIKNQNKGSLMVEIIIATSIIAVFVLASFNVAQKAIVLSRRAIHTSQAAFLLEEGAETVKIFRDNNTWANFTTFFDSANTYCLAGTVSDWGQALSTSSPCTQVDGFTRTIDVDDVNRDNGSGDIVSSGGTLDTGTKLITITVTWQESGNTITKNLKFYINNIFS